MYPLRTFFNIVEIKTKAVSIATFVFVSLSAAVMLKSNSQTFPWVNWWLMLAATLAVYMGTAGFNTYFNFLHGVDRLENNFEAEKILLHNGVSPARAFYTSAVLFLIAVIIFMFFQMNKRFFSSVTKGASWAPSSKYTCLEHLH